MARRVQVAAAEAPLVAAGAEAAEGKLEELVAGAAVEGTAPAARGAEARERARSQTEERARRAIDGGALREHRTRSFLDPGEGDDDPFDGLSPEEIAKLAEGEGKRETEGGA